jgi:hypothetical protein
VVKEQYENYVPTHLDDPKYVGNFEMTTVAVLFMAVAFSIVAFIKGQRLVALTILTAAITWLKLKSKYGHFLDGFLYWHLGVSKLPKKKMEKAREFGVVYTYVRDFEE